MARSLAQLQEHYSQVFPVGTAGIHFGKTLKQRRRKHLAKLDSFALFSGVAHEPGSENIWIMPGLRIFQEPSLIHLCGINQPQIILALIPGGKPEEILFVPEKDASKEFWDGVRFGLPQGGKTKRSLEMQDLRRLTGIQDIRPSSQFEPWFKKQVQQWKKSFGYAFFHEYPKSTTSGKMKRIKTDHNYAFKQKVSRIAQQIRKGFEIRPCSELHFRLRLPLDPFQILDVNQATAHTRSAFIDTLSQLKKLPDENALASYLDFRMRIQSPYGLSFPSIVAGGKNATILHYLKNDEKFDAGDLVLMDFGSRFGTMHADISRTVPVSGTFNPLQKLLYEIVLEATYKTEELAGPKVNIRQLNESVWAFIESALKVRFLDLGGKMKRAYTVRPHGLSHLMGEQEHDGDPFRFYQEQLLQPGWQISNEPGIYGHFSIKLNGKHYSESIGIRIEDNLLITKTGCLNLSATIPKEIKQIEAIIQKQNLS